MKTERSRASSPQQPYVSTASGMHASLALNISHHALEACFLFSETWADDPAVTHASLRML
jgi:hypothetical protein